jgi:hypothetical protein
LPLFIAIGILPRGVAAAVCHRLTPVGFSANAGERMRESGKWPHPLPVPQFDLECAGGRMIDLEDLRGRVLRIMVGSGDEETEPDPPSGVDVATIFVMRERAVRPAGACLARTPGCGRPGGPAIRAIGQIRSRLQPQSAPSPRTRSGLTRSADMRIVANPLVRGYLQHSHVDAALPYSGRHRTVCRGGCQNEAP